VYARFALRGVQQGRRVTIEFRDTNGHVVLRRVRSSGPALTWFSAHVDQQRIAQRLGYGRQRSRQGKTLGRVRFLVPALEPAATRREAGGDPHTIAVHGPVSLNAAEP
jgi:hypothetical protein